MSSPRRVVPSVPTASKRFLTLTLPAEGGGLSTCAPHRSPKYLYCENFQREPRETKDAFRRYKTILHFSQNSNGTASMYVESWRPNIGRQSATRYLEWAMRISVPDEKQAASSSTRVAVGGSTHLHPKSIPNLDRLFTGGTARNKRLCASVCDCIVRA